MRRIKGEDGNELVQGSAEWHLARCGVPTASEFKNLITPKWKIKEGAGPESYLNEKLAEAWQGHPLPAPKVFQMEQGNILEDFAIGWCQMHFDADIERVGFITTDDGRIGCSPDGLIGEGGIEIKCPLAQTHVGYLMDGVLPEEYGPQVHGCMFVTGRPWWRFVSYRRGFPQLVLQVNRDEKIQAVIEEALGEFLERFERGMKRLEEINGGPRPTISYPEREKLVKHDPELELEPTDVPMP